MKNKKTFHDIPNFNLIAATLLIMVKPNFILSLMLIDFSIGFSKTTDRTENVSRIHQPLTHRPINRLLLTYLKTIFCFFLFFLWINNDIYHWHSLDTSQKMKFSIKNFFSKCNQIHSFLRIWSHLLNKSLMKIVISCAVRIRHLNEVIEVREYCTPINRIFKIRWNEASNSFLRSVILELWKFFRISFPVL